MPSSVQDRTIVLYHDEALWKQRLAVSEDSRAYVLLLGSDSRIQWKNEGPFKDDAYAQLKDQLAGMLRSHS